MATPDEEERTLSEWSRTLTQALQILDLEVDHPRIVELAERSSQHVSPSAGAISAFLVGYAAGTVTTRNRDEASAAVEKAANTVTTVLRKDEETREEQGWTGSAQ
ncbi:DUF6457 domain-containing protein [Arthrobacter sp. MDT1-48-3]